MLSSTHIRKSSGYLLRSDSGTIIGVFRDFAPLRINYDTVIVTNLCGATTALFRDQQLLLYLFSLEFSRATIAVSITGVSER